MKKSNLLWGIILAATIMMWLTTVILWISIPEERTLNISTTVCAAALFVITVLMRKEHFKTFYKSSRFQSFSSNLFTAFLIAAILGLVNYLAYKNPFQWDITADGANTLTEQSRKVLKDAPEEIEAKVFAPKAQLGAVMKILELYQLEKRSLTITSYDPELRPDLVKEYELSNPLAVVWQHKEQRQVVYDINELGLTNALIRLSRSKIPKIFYDIGHGQGKLESNEHNGRSMFKQNLVNANFALQEIDTKRLSSIPEDVDVLMLWGPRSSYLPNEIEMFAKFLDGGGKLMIALDPDLNGDAFKELRQMLATRGIVASNALVIDTLNHVSGSNGTVPIVNRFASEHAITKNFQGQVFFPLAGFVSIGEQATGTEIAYSTAYPAAWAEMNSKEFVNGKVEFTEGVDVKGPVAFAAVVKPKTGGTVAYFANSTFIDNAYARYAANHVLLLNSLNWLTGDDQLISFDRIGIDNQPVFISSPQLGVIFFFSVVLAPLALFVTAAWNYRRAKML